jgi:ClpP class serine protease
MSKMLEYLYSRPWMIRPDLAEIAEAFLLERGDAALAQDADERKVRPKAVERELGIPYDRSEAEMTVRGATAIIPVVGPIFRYANWFTNMCGGTTVEAVARDFAKAMDDGSIDSVVMAIDSGGGEAAGIGELAGMIRDGASRKSTVAYVSDCAASAGYYLASAASSLILAPMATVGSIGVISMYPRKRESKSRAEIVSSQSPRKRVDVDTDDGRAVIQSLVDDLADVFIGDVAKYRGVSSGKVVKDFGGGGMLVGAKSVAAGMADSLGTFEGVLAEMAAARQRRFTQVQVGPATPNGVLSMPPENAGVDAQTEPAHTQQPVTQYIPAPPAMTAEEAASLRAEIAAIRANQATQQANAIVAQADAFLSIHRDKIPPAERPTARENYIQAAMDDAASPLPTGTRVAKLEAQVKARPVHPLLGGGSQYVPAGAHTLPTGDEERPGVAGSHPSEFPMKQTGEKDIPTTKTVAELVKADPEIENYYRKNRQGAAT